MNPCPDIRRRSIFKLAGAVVASMATTTTTASVVQPKLNNVAFKMGVASGAPSSDGFVLWTRIFGDDLPSSFSVRWKIFKDNTNQLVQEGVAACSKVLGHSVHVEVSGLKPDNWYSYKFYVEGVESSVGRVRTLPTQDVHFLKIAFASCQRWEDGFYAAYRHMLRDNPDYVFFLGDYIYEKRVNYRKKKIRPHNIPTAVSLEDFRRRYELYRSDTDLQRMHQACAWIVTWDDHEVENNYAGKESSENTQKFPDLRANAYQAYYENMPIKLDDALRDAAMEIRKNGLRLYTVVDVGNLVRFYILDNRQYRSIPACNDRTKHDNFENCKPVKFSSESMLGKNQEVWLDTKFSESETSKFKWNIVVQQTRFTTGAYEKGDSGGASLDSWDAFPASRARLIGQIINNRLENVIILGGDIHANWVANVHANPYDVTSNKIAVEFVGTSISSSTKGDAKWAARKKSRNPHCVYFDPTQRGYGLVQIEKSQVLVFLKGLVNVEDKDSSIRSVKQFVVKSGDANVTIA